MATRQSALAKIVPFVFAQVRQNHASPGGKIDPQVITMSPVLFDQEVFWQG